MRPGPDHETWVDAAGAYLLHAMPDDERAGYEAHLEQCAACRAEVEHLRVAADALPASPIQLVPPPELKDRIMAVVNSEAELLRAAGPDADVPARDRRERRGFWQRWSLRPGLALAGVTAALVLGVVGGQALLTEEIRTQPTEVAVTGASAELRIPEGDDNATLVAHRLPHPGEGRVYQVWLQRKGSDTAEPTDALFTVRPGGEATVEVPGSLDDVAAVMVTSEPDGGSDAPTRKPIIVASLS